MSPAQRAQTLTPFFAPREIVVIGASRKPQRLGHVLARNACRFSGPVHLVNPGGGSLFDRPLHGTIGAVPGNPDLAILLVPAEAAAATLTECAARGIRHAVLASGGFSETGPAGAACEDAVRDVVHRFGMRLIGPNCVGVIETATGVDTSFLAGEPAPAGGVAFVSQSGALCASIIEWAAQKGFGLSRLVSVGNMLDVSVADVLDTLVDDDATRVVLLYLEGLPDGRRFVEAVARVAQRRPVIALKAGRSDAGRQAAASHTGALAGHDAAWAAAFRRAGVMRASGLQELLDAAVVFERSPLPSGGRVAILTNAGGPGVSTADLAIEVGLEVPTLPEATQRVLAEALPPAAGVRNPVDLLASAAPEDYARALRRLIESDAVDAIVVLLPTPPSHPAVAVARAIADAAVGSSIPVLPVLLGAAGIRDAADLLRSRHLPVFDVPEQAIGALRLLVDRAMFEGRPSSPPATRIPPPKVAVGTLIDPLEAARRAAAAGIAVSALRAAESLDDAVRMASSVGYPVALKLWADQVTHKSDVGGVALSLPDGAAVEEAFAAMRGHGTFRGVFVQAMAPDGIDLLVGAVRDPQFGPMVAVGAGGTEVEMHADVAFLLAPTTHTEVMDALMRTTVGRRLSPHRGRPGRDIDAVVDAVVRVGGLLHDDPTLAEFEINPLRVFERGRGAVALDIRAVALSEKASGTKIGPESAP